jgi:biopolymer transport protein ExbD
MTFDQPPRRARGENIVPMINIVFLLLIFFLLTATIAPPDPFPLTPPEAEGVEAEVAPGTPLHVAADGTVALGPLRDEAAWTALQGHEGALVLRADAALPGVDLAALLMRLATLGLTEVDLTVARR